MTIATWRRAVLASLALLVASPASAAWRKAESANFILYSEANETKVREQLALLEDYHEFLRALTGVTDPPSPNKLPVYLVRGRGQLRIVRDVREGTAGFYVATPSGIAAFADDRVGGGDGDQVLLHEIAHHFMMQYRPNAYPAWYVEGFAEYVMTAKFKPDAIEFGLPSPVRLTWLTRARWLPIEQVLFAPPPKRPQDRALFYAQSWLVTHFMLRDPVRQQKFKAFIQAIGTGTEPRTAFVAQFGTIKAFDRALETYAQREMTFTKRSRASIVAQPGMTVTTLPASAEDLLLREATMHVGVGERYGEALLAGIRGHAAKFPGDAYATRVLAEAEVLLGDGAKGDTLLDQLLKSQPGDAELLYLKGMRHLIRARAAADDAAPAFKDARIWFARAYKAHPNHFPTLLGYAESLQGDPRFDSDNTGNILLRAQELAPQVEQATMHAARLLLMRGKFEQAERLLLPLAFNPHSERLAAAASAMLASARARSRTPLPVAAGAAPGAE